MLPAAVSSGGTPLAAPVLLRGIRRIFTRRLSSGIICCMGQSRFEMHFVCVCKLVLLVLLKKTWPHIFLPDPFQWIEAGPYGLLLMQVALHALIEVIFFSFRSQILSWRYITTSFVLCQ
jgi:hypothetical protein